MQRVARAAIKRAGWVYLLMLCASHLLYELLAARETHDDSAVLKGTVHLQPVYGIGLIIVVAIIISIIVIVINIIAIIINISINAQRHFVLS